MSVSDVITRLIFTPSAFVSLSVPLNIVPKFLFAKFLQTVHIKGITALNG